jgi:SIR2-like domain
MRSDAKASKLLLSDLRERIATGRAVAIVGAGVALASTEGNPLADWKGLLQDGIKRCEQVVPGLPSGWGDLVRRELDSGDTDDLLSAAQKVEAKLKRTGQLAGWLVDTVGQLQVRDGSVIDAIRELRIPILTTNYDGLIEKRVGVSPVTWREPTKYERVIQGDREGVLHLHGFYEEPDSVVLGVSSYEAALRGDYAQAMQRAVRSLHTLISIGYGKGIEDPNFSALLEWSRKLFSDSTYRHYRLELAKDVEEIQSEHDSKDRVFVLPYGEKHEDLPLFLRSLSREQGTRGVTPKGADPPANAAAGRGTPNAIQPLAEVRGDVGPSPEMKLEVDQTASVDGPNDGAWSDELNERRIELIDKDIQGNIATGERAELAELQRKAVAYRDRVAPLPIEAARRLHQQLLEMKRQQEGS